MNPNHNQQQGQYSFHQHTPGPPQPQWQPSPGPTRNRWGDPRMGAASPAAASPASSYPAFHGYGQPSGGQPLPPPPPPPQGGFPAAPQISTPNAAWGVKYNQTQQQQQPPPPRQDDALRPPLPPRPPSAQDGSQTGWNVQSPQQAPPIVPPRPPEYAVPQQQGQNQYYPHEQYSNRPSSHQYEPQVPQWPPVQPQNKPPGLGWQHNQNFQDGPVSPIEQPNQGWNAPSPAPPANKQNYAQQLPPPPPPPTQSATPAHSSSIPAPSASALGYGGPSDWQHFPGDDHYYQEQSSHQQQQQTQQTQTQTPQPQLHPDPHGRHGSLSFTTTPDQVHSMPVQSPAQSNPFKYAQAVPATSSPSRPPPSQQPPPHRLSMQYNKPAPPNDAPPPRARYGSDATASSVSLPDQSGNFDSVINAWTAADVKVEPLKSPQRPKSASVLPGPAPRAVTSIQTQTDFPPIVKTETKIETKIETREIDPYEDLKNEYRTSLNRYATMLRQEMAAQGEQEKLKIVFDFVNREVKLRAVMFNAEPAELVRSSELAELRKAAEKAKQEEVMRIPSDTSANQASSAPRAITPRPAQPSVGTPSSQHSRDDSFVVINPGGEDGEYSPGGRPRVLAQPKVPPQQRSVSPAIQIAPPRTQNPAQQYNQPSSPSANAPMTLDDYIMPDHSSTFAPERGLNATPANIQRPGSTGPAPPPKKPINKAPIPFQPARPAYTPFTYSEAAQPPPQLINNNNPADQAYTKLRHEQASDSGRLLSQESSSLAVSAPDRVQTATPSRARQQQEEAFIGLLRQQTRAVRRPQTTPPAAGAPAPLRAGTPMKRRQSMPPLVKSSETLRQSLPPNIAQMVATKQTHPKINQLNASLANIIDDFSYIHATVLGWNEGYKKIRLQLDKERTERESDNQSHIDDLFNNDEIGYADIADLEEDFKVAEAAKKYDEDQRELESFSSDVFEKVTGRLQKEVSELETLRIKTVDLIDLGSQSAAGRLRAELSNPNAAMDKAPLNEAMNVLFQVYQKIEVRQRKTAEAHFERERRRKKLELSVLYTNGDTAGSKKLEKDFDKAQAMQELSEARKRDERANRLMDCFDRSVVRGLAENQEWVDDISNKASLLRDLVLGSESNGPQGRDREDLLYGPGGIREIFDSLQEAVSLVNQDSKDLVQISGQADGILNEADFAMFLAEAKIAEANDTEFEKLHKEKAKEDQKLRDEAQGRMNGIQRGPDEIYGFVKDVRSFIGDDKDHQTRINQALERAKERNQSPPGVAQGPTIGSVKEV